MDMTVGTSDLAHIKERPELGEHSMYLAETGVFAILELGLEATLREYKNKQGQMYTTPTAYLASWLMRNNPKHSQEGADMVQSFLAMQHTRAELADVSALEEAQHEQAEERAAAVRMQAAARMHAAQVAKGEQAKAATSLQACQRSRNVRKQLAAENEAAARVQAGIRSKGARKQLEKEHEAAAKVQAGIRGNAVRREIAAEHEAAASVQAVHRGRQVRSAPPRAAPAGAEPHGD